MISPRSRERSLGVCGLVLLVGALALHGPHLHRRHALSEAAVRPLHAEHCLCAHTPPLPQAGAARLEPAAWLELETSAEYTAPPSGTERLLLEAPKHSPPRCSQSRTAA